MINISHLPISLFTFFRTWRSFLFSSFLFFLSSLTSLSYSSDPCFILCLLLFRCISKRLPFQIHPSMGQSLFGRICFTSFVSAQVLYCVFVHPCFLDVRCLWSLNTATLHTGHDVFWPFAAILSLSSTSATLSVSRVSNSRILILRSLFASSKRAMRLSCYIRRATTVRCLPS